VSNIASLSSAQFIEPARLLDLTGGGPQQVVSQRLLEKWAVDLRPGDIALLWTGFSERYYERSDFLRWSPRFDLQSLEWLLDCGAKMLVTDAASLEPHPWDDHLSSSVDPFLATRGVPAVVCATNLWLLRKEKCFVICSPIPH
jgi:kynurenine formamidase